MSITDYLIDLFLIGLVVVQMRGRRITTRSLLLPLVVVGVVAAEYLHGIPTAGNDLVLVAGGAAVGLTLGALTGVLTRVTRREDGSVFARAGLVAAVLWVLGVGSRFAFQLYATHGGGEAIVRFSAAHSITSASAWVACLLLMAIGEVVARSGVVALRAHGARLTGTAQGCRTDVSRKAAIMETSAS